MQAILYLSQATIDFDEDMLDELARKAAICNATHNITGYLWFKKGQFIQYIEGEEEQLKTLMASIETDPRHKVLNSLVQDKLTRQRFPSWSMRYISQKMAYEIGLETILRDQLLFMNTLGKRGKEFSKNLWRIVDTISNHGV